MYNISECASFKKSLSKLSNPIKKKIEHILGLLKDDPSYLLSESIQLEPWKYRYKLNSFYRLDFIIDWKNIVFNEIADLWDNLPNIEVVKIKEKLPKWIFIFIFILFLLTILISIIVNKSTTRNKWEYNNIITTWTAMNSGVINQDYRFFSWEQTLRLIKSGDNFVVKDWLTANLWDQYPKIIIKDTNISQAILRLVIDFKDTWVEDNWWLVYWYSVSYEDWKIKRTPAPWYVFSLKFGFWNVRNWDVEYWGWYNVVNYGISPSNKYSNNENLGLNGAYHGKDIIWGKEYIIEIDKVLVWYQPRKSETDPIIKALYPITYLTHHLNKPIPVSAWLSDAGILWTVIKEMEIIYVGWSWSIEIYQ